jgi:hypothetical protein
MGSADVAKIKVQDCGDEGCGECDICRYLNFLEMAQQVAPPGSKIRRNKAIEKHLDANYPHWRR